jgi:hypothetical protein
MIEHKSNPRIFIFFATFVAVFVTAALVTYLNISPTDVMLRAAIIAIVPYALWLLFEHFAWRWPLVRFFGLIVSLPDLNGRWEGVVDRDGEEQPHPFVMEVTQTFSAIRTKTFSAHSRGESLVAKLVKSSEDGDFKLLVIWQTVTSQNDNPSRRETFVGCSTFEIGNSAKKADILSDRYFTDRTVQTRGHVDLKLVSRTRRNTFK